MFLTINIPLEDEQDNLDTEETVYATAISALTCLNTVQSITWQKVQEATSSDPEMLELLNTVQAGFKYNAELAPHLKPYTRFKQFLTTVDGVVLYKNRIVIPPTLRAQILENLHSAHQGVSSMVSRADAAVFWPNIISDIHSIRDRCFA